MRHTNWEKTAAVFRGRKAYFPRTSSFAVWTVSSVSLLALLILTGLASYASLSLLSAPHASAVTTVPTKLNFQGRLSDSAGSIKANGTYNMKFKLYTVATAGSAVWSEDRLVSATQGVTVTNGLFSVQLGSVTSLPASLFASGALYLEVELPTPATATSASPTWTEGPMTPRNQMATSAYAYNSETLDGQDGAWYQDASNLNAGTIASARLTGAYTGITQVGTLTSLSMSGNLTTTAGVLSVQGTGNNYFAGNVGIGAAIPGDLLSLAKPGATDIFGIHFYEGGGTAYGARIQYDNGGDILKLVTVENNVEQLGIAIARTNGRVGIGTATPGASYKLDVQGGDINTSGSLRSSVITGTAPLVVSSTTKVTSLNADLLDGLDSTAFGDATAANQTTILNRIGTNADAAGTSTVFARLASIDTSKLGASADAASSTGSIFARLAYLISSIGATTDAASSTGSVNAKLAYLIANSSSGVPSDNVQIFTTSGTWTKPAGAKTVEVWTIGGGGGGGGTQSGSGSPGGTSGGGGGGVSRGFFSGAALGSTESVTVGAGGAGGVGRTAGDTNTAAVPGADGGASYFAGGLVAEGGSGGTTCACTSMTGSSGGFGSFAVGGAGGGFSSQAGLFGENSLTGGGGGTSHYSGKIGGAGGGGAIGSAAPASAASTSGPIAGSNAVARAINGNGGGSGGSVGTTNPSAGANGGNGGYGGGGGGGVKPFGGSAAGGTGGNGGSGLVIIITKF